MRLAWGAFPASKRRLPAAWLGCSLLGSCLFFAPLCRAQAAEDSGADYARAEALVRSHAWEEGLAALASLLEREPRNVKALNLAGLAWSGKGDLATAESYFEKALAADPRFLPALKNLGIAEFQAQQSAAAEKHLTEARKQLPNDPAVNFFLGQIAYRQQRFQLAAECLAHAGDLVLRSPDATAALAVSYLRSAQKQPAIELLDRIPVPAIDPRSQLALGISLAQADLNAQAIPYLQAAFDRDPDSYDIGFDLALSGDQAKDYATAVAAIGKLIAGGHDSSELENLLAEARESQGQTQAAVDAYRKAIALDPKDENNYLDFASLCVDHRAFDDGMKVISTGLLAHPKSEKLTFMRGILYAMQDHFELAESDFKEAARLAPEHDYGDVGLGVTYLEIGNSAEAIKILRARLRQKPNDASLQFLLGEGLLRSGAAPGQPAYHEAQAALEKSVQLNPKLCLPHVSLGSIYLDENRLPEAAMQFEAARAIDPSEKSAYSHLAVVYRRLGQPEKAREALTALKQVLDQQRAGMRVTVKSVAEDKTAAGAP